MKNIVFGFKRVFFKEAYAPIDYKNRDLYMNNARIIIQAVGRICRSPNKNKNILIITEKEVIERLNFEKEELDKRLLNKEFEMLFYTPIKRPTLEIDKFNIINYGSKKLIDKLSNQVRNSQEKVQEWKKIRDEVLKYPTYVGDNDILNPFYYDFKFPINSYFYKFKGYKICDVNLDTRDNYYQVSSSSADLGKLISVQCVDEYFEKHNYAKNFKKGNKIMTPSVYNQIYLGALGEAAGKAILERYLEISLDEIEDYKTYEYFDYKVNNVYIDFKNWKSFNDDNIRQIKKIYKKLNKIKGEKAIIINVIKRTDSKSIIMNLPKNIIQIPWLVDYEGKVDIEQINKISKFIME